MKFFSNANKYDVEKLIILSSCVVILIKANKPVSKDQETKKKLKKKIVKMLDTLGLIVI